MKIFAPTIITTIILASWNCTSQDFSGSKAHKTAPSEIPEPISSENLAAGAELGMVVDRKTIRFSIDLVIALDSSGSMGEERQAVAANLSQMMLALQNDKLDPIIHLIAGRQDADDDEAPPTGPIFTFPPDIDGSRVALVVQEVGSHDALSHISRLLSGLYASSYFDVKSVKMNTPLPLRPDANLEILIITDDNAENGENFDPNFSNLAKDFDPDNKWQATVNGIIGLTIPNPPVATCQVEAIGQEYLTLVKKTSGTALDICSSDWSIMIKKFSEDLIIRSRSLKLSQKPLNPANIQVRLNDQLLKEGEWIYEEEKNLVSLAATLDLKAGMELSVQYHAR